VRWSLGCSRERGEREQGEERQEVNGLHGK
jgi:hypothetical protein